MFGPGRWRGVAAMPTPRQRRCNAGSRAWRPCTPAPRHPRSHDSGGTRLGGARQAATATAVLIAALLVTAVAASAAEPGDTIVLDQPSGFGDPLRGAGNYSASSAGAVSADGRYVVFWSGADGLSEADDNGHTNVFRKDRLTGELALVSVTGDGKPANGNSYGARISDDGKRVVFVSYATNLDTSAPGGERYAYLRDLDARTTALSSRGQGQVGEPGPANDVAISGDGQPSSSPPARGCSSGTTTALRTCTPGAPATRSWSAAPPAPLRRSTRAPSIPRSTTTGRESR